MYCHLQGGNGSYLVLSDIGCFGSIETVEKVSLVMSGIGCFGIKLVKMVLPCNEWRWMFCKQNG